MYPVEEYKGYNLKVGRIGHEYFGRAWLPGEDEWTGIASQRYAGAGAKEKAATEIKALVDRAQDEGN